MGPQYLHKKKDLMSASMEGFWQSDMKIATPKFNTPRLKSSEDNAFDSLWGRSNASQGSRYVKNVQPVKYKQEISPQKIRLAQLKDRLEMQKVQKEINAMNAQEFRENVQNFREAGRKSYNVARGAYRTTAPVVRKAVETATPIVKRAARSAVNFIHKATEHPVKQEPVGLAGALHTARIRSGKSSIYK